MLRRVFYILLLLLLICSPKCGWSQVSQTVTFTLSVTIPERTEIPAAPLINDNTPILAKPILQQPSIQTDIRDNQLVYLVSFTID